MGQRAFTVLVREIQGDDLVLILDIVVDHALAIGNGELRPTTHGMVATTVSVAGSITEASLLFPFIVKICLEAGSYECNPDFHRF